MKKGRERKEWRVVNVPRLVGGAEAVRSVS